MDIQLSRVDSSYVDGKLVKPDVDDIKEHWLEDSVAFLSEFFGQGINH